MSIFKKYYSFFNKSEKYNNSQGVHTLENSNNSNNNIKIDMPILGDLKSPIYTNKIIESLRNSNLDDINQQKKTLYSLLKKTHNTKESKTSLNYTIYRSIKHRYRKYDYKNYPFYKDNSKKTLLTYSRPLVNEYEF